MIDRFAGTTQSEQSTCNADMASHSYGSETRHGFELNQRFLRATHQQKRIPEI